MGKFIDEPTKKYSGKFIDENVSEEDGVNSSIKRYLPNIDKVEQNISERPDSIASASELKKTGHPILSALSVAGTPFQRSESAIANAALAIQRGDDKSIVNDFVKGITGEKTGQFGDVIRTTGFGGGFNEALASSVGFMTAMPVASKVASGVVQTAKVGNKVVSSLVKKSQNAVDSVKQVVDGIKYVKDPAKFSSNIRNDLFSNKKSVGDAFGKAMQELEKKNPNASVDLSDSFLYMKEAMDDVSTNPGLASQIKSVIRNIKDPTLSKQVASMIENPANASAMSLSTSNRIKTAIKDIPSIKQKLSQGKFAQWQDGEREVLDLLDDIKLSQSSSFPEIADIRKPYADYMNAYKQVKSMFKPSSLENKIRNGFGTQEIENMVRVVLPQKAVRDIDSFRKTTKAINTGKQIGKVGAGLIIGERLINQAGKAFSK